MAASHPPSLLFALLFCAFLFLAGCASPPQAGYSGPNYSVGKSFDDALRLSSKDSCIFGQNLFFVKAKDNRTCQYLKESHFYHVRGPIVGQETAQTSDMLVAHAMVTSLNASLSTNPSRIALPVVDMQSVSEADYAEVALEHVLWSQDIGGDVVLSCTRDPEGLEFPLSDGSTVLVPKNTSSPLVIHLEKMMFGKAHSSGLNLSWIQPYELLVSFRHPDGVEPFSNDFVEYSDGGRYVGLALDKIDHAEHVSFGSPSPIRPTDINRLHLTLIGPERSKPLFCGGFISPDMRFEASELRG